jgi:DNA-binding PadR family transcriptional regulator
VARPDQQGAPLVVGPIYRVDTSSCYGATVLDLAVLGLLTEQPLHGYELKKRLTDLFGIAHSVSFGSLYPALGRLETLGAVAVVAEDSSAVADGLFDLSNSVGGESPSSRTRGAATRPTPVRGGRSRKVYAVTAQGQALFHQLLTEGGAPEDDRTFTLRLAFARYLSPALRITLLERRRAVLSARADEVAARSSSRRRSLDRYVRSLAEREQESLERELEWLGRLVDEERSAPETNSARSSAKDRRPSPDGEPLASLSQLQRGP